MTGPSNTTRHPPPEPERIERALRAMHARRAKLRRRRIIGVSGALAAVAVVVLAAIVASPGNAPRLRVEGQPSTTTSLAAGTTTSTTRHTETSTTGTSTPGTSTTSIPTTAVAGTQQITYQPFTATGTIDPGLQVTASVTGTCTTGETSRTYRCFGATSGGIYDPCFPGPHGTTQPLVCPRNPTTRDIVEVTATAVTSQPPVTTTGPWAMQLSGGQVCLFVSAAWSGLGPYDCQLNNSKAMPADCRQPQPSQPWWTAECQDQKTNARPFTTTRVSKVWF